MCLYGIWARLPHLEMQYAAGYNFARLTMRPKLDQLLQRRTKRLLLPAMSGNIRWDPKTQTFIPIPA